MYLFIVGLLIPARRFTLIEGRKQAKISLIEGFFGKIESVDKGIVVRDDIEFGHANIVPLWAFGLNY